MNDATAVHLFSVFLRSKNMSEDPYLLQREVFAPGHKNSRPTMSKVLWKLAGELKPPVRLALISSPCAFAWSDHSRPPFQVVTISYERNKLVNTDSLDTLNQYVPTLRNFSIAHNPLETINSIKAMISLKTGLVNLQELITVGCPFRDKEIAERGEEGYRT